MRSLLRALAYAAFVAAVAIAVIDGTASIAGQTLMLTPFGELVVRVIGLPAINVFQAGVERHVHPLLWDPGIQSVLVSPAFLVFTALGILLWLAGREPREPIGISPHD